MSYPARSKAPGTVDVIVIGAGHAGLAMSHHLGGAGIDHLVLERGEVANSWRNERWDSLRLLTPNWQSRLPGYEYCGADPDGYMNLREVVGFIAGYATRLGAPVMTQTRVDAVRADERGYRVVTSRGDWICRALVIASGACNRPAVPAIAAALPESIQQVTSQDYRNPRQLDEGRVLVVGASASGLQLAEEIHLSGRPVTLAVGEHLRLPRTYRGRDIFWWMQASGMFDQGLQDFDDLQRVRGLPSPQLIGTDVRRNLDLNGLAATGIRLVGRLAGIRDGKAQFSGSLANTCALADLKMTRLLDAIDEWIASAGHGVEPAPLERPRPTRIPRESCLGLDLADRGFSTVVWATGYRSDYSWLELPVLDRKGRLRHDGGRLCDAPGVYALGLPFMRRRKSSFIHGADDDARDICADLKLYLDGAAAEQNLRAVV